MKPRVLAALSALIAAAVGAWLLFSSRGDTPGGLPVPEPAAVASVGRSSAQPAAAAPAAPGSRPAGARIQPRPVEEDEPRPPPPTTGVQIQPSVTLIVRVRPEDPRTELKGLVVVLAPTEGKFRSHPVQPGQDLALGPFFSGTEFEISVEDLYGGVLVRENVTLRDDDGTHPVEFVVVSKPRVIRGTVLDHQGRPLAEAGVTIVNPRIGWTHPKLFSGATTDALGKFEFGGVYALEVSVSVYADSHVVKTVVVESSKEPLTLRLERGRVLTVKVTGVPSAIFGGAVTFEMDGGETRVPNRRAESAFWFDGLPCRPGTLRAAVEGAPPSSILVGPEETEVSIAHP